jgi:hypothetical protein
MGVRGLTSLFKTRRFYDNYKLSNCHLIIDGYAFASVLYREVCSNPALGGDYDRYGMEVEWWFKELLRCGVVPVVVFGGTYKKKDFWKKRKNFLSKVLNFQKLSPYSIPDQNFPLMLRKAFLEKLVELGIALVQSDFQDYGQMAALAKKLDCPVLSDNSDFLIYNVGYIPLTSFPFSSPSLVRGQAIPCIIFRVKLFLNSFGVSESMLPLLAAIVTTYEKYSTQHQTNHIKTFFDSLNVTIIPFRHKKFIPDVISWLRKESFDSALKKV